ncbi:NUDIX domain-containing protein [Streptomyces sp. NPDC004232]|uniref:NUDIX hydrolase n=1 Tax=Streptomyces sp. NPDC004232 TaxID=3154454 RepID=UPI0033A68093
MTEAPGIAAAVIVHDGRLLLVRRRVAEGSLSWTLPAGKVEPGETVGAAAVREALEEAGVTVEPVRFLGERVHPESGRRMSYTACRLLAGTARAASPREVAEVAWVTRAEVAELIPGDLYSSVQEYLTEVVE